MKLSELNLILFLMGHLSMSHTAKASALSTQVDDLVSTKASLEQAMAQVADLEAQKQAFTSQVARLQAEAQQSLERSHSTEERLSSNLAQLTLSSDAQLADERAQVAALQQQAAMAAKTAQAESDAAAGTISSLEQSVAKYKDELATALADMESTTASLGSSHASEVRGTRPTYLTPYKS